MKTTFAFVTFLLFSFSNPSHAIKLKSLCQKLLSKIDTQYVASEEALYRVLQGLDPDESNVVMFAIKSNQSKPKIQNDLLHLAHGFGVALLTELTESEKLAANNRLYIFTVVGDEKNIKSFVYELKSVSQLNWIKPIVVESNRIETSDKQNLSSSKFQIDFEKLLKHVDAHQSVDFSLNLLKPQFTILNYELFQSQQNKHFQFAMFRRPYVITKVKGITMPRLSKYLEDVKQKKSHLVFQDNDGNPKYIVMPEKDFNILSRFDEALEKQAALGVAASETYIQAVIQRSLDQTQYQSNVIHISDINKGVALPNLDFAILETDKPIALAINVYKILNVTDVEKSFRTLFGTALSAKAKKAFGLLNTKDGQYNSRLVHLQQTQITPSELTNYNNQMIVVVDDEGRAHTLLFPHFSDGIEMSVIKDIAGPGPRQSATRFKTPKIQTQLKKPWDTGPQYFVVESYKKIIGLVFSLNAVRTGDIESIQKIYFETFGAPMEERVKQSVIEYQSIGEDARILRYVLSTTSLDTQGAFAQVITEEQQPLYFVFKAPSQLSDSDIYKSLFLDYQNEVLDDPKFSEAMSLFSNLSPEQLNTVLTDLESTARDWMSYIKVHSPRPDQRNQEVARALTVLAILSCELLQIPVPNTLTALKTFSTTAQLYIEHKIPEDSERLKVLENLRLLSFLNDKRHFRIVSALTRERARKILEMPTDVDYKDKEIQFLLGLIAKKMVAAIGLK